MIPGLEEVRIIRPGYAIEYDFVDPRELGPDLQTTRIPGSVPCRTDKRNDRLRRGRMPGTDCRDQRRALGAGPTGVSISGGKSHTSAFWLTI